MYLCWFSSSAKHVALLLLMFSLKSFCIVRAFGAYLFPFFCLLSQKKGFKFLQCWLCFLNWYYKLHFMTLANKGQELLKKSSIPHRKWNIKISKKSFQCEQKITKKNEKGKKVSFLSTISYSNVHLTRVINYMGLEFLYHKRRRWGYKRRLIFWSLSQKKAHNEGLFSWDERIQNIAAKELHSASQSSSLPFIRPLFLGCHSRKEKKGLDHISLILNIAKRSKRSIAKWDFFTAFPIQNHLSNNSGNLIVCIRICDPDIYIVLYIDLLLLFTSIICKRHLT